MMMVMMMMTTNVFDFDFDDDAFFLKEKHQRNEFQCQPKLINIIWKFIVVCPKSIDIFSF